MADSGSGRRAFRASEDPSEAERALWTHCFGLHRGPRRFWAWLCGGWAAQPPTSAPRPSQPRADGKATASVRLGGQTSPSAQNEARRHFASTPARQEERGGARSQRGRRAVLVRGDNILCVEDAGPSRVPDGRGQPRGCSHGDARRREALFTAATDGYGKGFSESRDGNEELRCA